MKLTVVITILTFLISANFSFAEVKTYPSGSKIAPKRSNENIVNEQLDITRRNVKRHKRQNQEEEMMEDKKQAERLEDRLEKK